MQIGMQKGMQKGRQKGMQKGQIEFQFKLARQMLMAGEPIEKIKIYTGLTEEQIRSVLQ